MPSIASLPLAPAMALVTLLPPDGALQIRPAGDGLLCLEAVGRVMAAAVELEGESTRRVAIDRKLSTAAYKRLCAVSRQASRLLYLLLFLVAWDAG